MYIAKLSHCVAATMELDTGDKPRLTLYPHVLTILCFVMVVVAFSVAYIISVEEGFVTYPQFFLSKAINFAPAANVGSFFLSPTAFLFVLVGFVRYAQFEMYKPGTVLNKIGLAFVVLSSIGGHGVASVQDSAAFDLHVAAAAIFFGFGALYLLLIVVNDLRYPDFGAKWSRRFRIVLAANMVICAIALLVVTVSGGGTDTDIGRAAVLEIVAFVSFIAIWLSFVVDFRELRIVVYLRDTSTSAEIQQELGGKERPRGASL